VQLVQGGIREHEAFFKLDYEMKGPAGTGRGGVSMAGGQEGRRREGGRGEGLSLAITAILF